ncbi:hypothetical protein SFRURICE_012013 [Spodoptera frugiperda]|nr:hypothetical protein SFRURICE_012013 [Spodoptera frugiperda]
MVETKSAKLCFLYGKIRVMDVCYGWFPYYQYIAHSSCVSSSHSYSTRKVASSGSYRRMNKKTSFNFFILFLILTERDWATETYDTGNPSKRV